MLPQSLQTHNDMSNTHVCVSNTCADIVICLSRLIACCITQIFSYRYHLQQNFNSKHLKGDKYMYMYVD